MNSSVFIVLDPKPLLLLSGLYLQSRLLFKTSSKWTSQEEAIQQSTENSSATSASAVHKLYGIDNMAFQNT